MEVPAAAMLTTIEKILFVLLVFGSFYYGGTKFYAVYRAIARGKPDDRFDRLPERIWRALWIVLTQQSVFKKRPVFRYCTRLSSTGFSFISSSTWWMRWRDFSPSTRAAADGISSISSPIF
jgi:hypothetical protein